MLSDTRPDIRRSFTRAAVTLLAALLAVHLPTAGAPTAAAQSSGGGLIDREYTIKAAYLYNFGSYVTWPPGTFADDNAPFVIGVFGHDPFGTSLDKIAKTRELGGRTIVVRGFRTVEDYTPCQILFVPRSTDAGLRRQLTQRVAGAPVLLVGETPGFAKQGGIINFYIFNNNVRFEINPDVAKERGLKISAKLLRVATIVRSP